MASARDHATGNRDNGRNSKNNSIDNGVSGVGGGAGVGGGVGGAHRRRPSKDTDPQNTKNLFKALNNGKVRTVQQILDSGITKTIGQL